MLHLSHTTDLHEPLWSFHPDEVQLMKAEWENLKRHRLRPSKETSARKLKLWDKHSSRLALRYLELFFINEYMFAFLTILLETLTISVSMKNLTMRVTLVNI